MASSSFNYFNHVRGETNPTWYAVDSATVIKVGDLVWLDTNDVKPLDQFTWDTSITLTNKQLRTRILGVALSESASGDTDDLRIATSGVFDFTCAAATFEIGDLVGLVKQSGNFVENAKVVKVTDARLAIGRVARRYSSNTTTVEVEIFPVASGNGAGVPKIESVVLAGTGVVSGAADIVTDWTPGRRIKIVRAWAVTNVAVTTASAVLTLTSTGGAIDDTLEVTTGAMGEFHEADISDANGYDYLEADDTLGVASDGGSDAGEVTFGIDFYEVGEAA